MDFALPERSCRRIGSRGRRRQREKVAVRITQLRQRRVVTLNIVAEHDPQAQARRERLLDQKDPGTSGAEAGGRRAEF